MTKKPEHKPDDPAQSQRFIDMAKEVEADESPDAMDRAIGKIAIRTPISPSTKKDGEKSSS